MRHTPVAGFRTAVTVNPRRRMPRMIGPTWLPVRLVADSVTMMGDPTVVDVVETLSFPEKTGVPETASVPWAMASSLSGDAPHAPTSMSELAHNTIANGFIMRPVLGKV